MSTEKDISNVLRPMAWERAKGELSSMLHTYWHDERYEPFLKLVREFVDAVEANGLHE
jgi:hypothetical protein